MDSSERRGRRTRTAEKSAQLRALGARLQTARENRRAGRLTQQEVAERVGVAFQTVSNWESGAREPGLVDFFQLALLYEESPTYLITGERAEGLADLPAARRVYEELRTRTPEQQKELLDAFLTMLGRDPRQDEDQGGRR